jgi:hypothetical protein
MYLRLKQKNRFPVAELGNRFFYLMAGADSCHRRRYAVNYPQYVQDCSRWIQSLFFHKIINICLPLADIIRNQNTSDFGLDVLALHGSSSHAPSRFPDSPIFTLSYLLTNNGYAMVFQDSAPCLQWPDRSGFAPDSLSPDFHRHLLQQYVIHVIIIVSLLSFCQDPFW